MWKRIIGFTALCSSLSACSGGDSGTAFSGDAGRANGGAASGGGSNSGGATNPASGGAASTGARGGTAGGASNGGAANGGAGGTSAAGGGGAGGTAASGGVTGAGGAIPKPYCNGQSADLSTDLYNCGACGKICQPALVASALNAPGSVIADANYVYWAEHTASGRVFRVPLGSPSTQNPTAIATNQKNPHALVTSATNVYWITDDAVWKRPIGSSSAAPVATDPAGRNPGDIALDATSVYFTIHSDTSPNYAAVKKMPLAGGAAVEIATLPVIDFRNIAVNGTNVFFVYTEHLGPVTSQQQNEIIYTVPLGGGTPVELYRFTPYVSIRQLIANEQYLYIGIYERQPSIPPTVNDEARVMRLALTGGEPEWIVGAFHEMFAGFDINAQGTFLAANNGNVVGGSIDSAPNGIGMSMALAVPTHPTSLSVTETHLYYSEWEDNGLNNGLVYRNGLCVGSVCQ